MRFILMSGNRYAKGLAAAVGQALTDIAVAFGHSFVIKEVRIGSRQPEEIATSLPEARAVVAVCESGGWAAGLAEALGCRLRLQHYRLHPRLSDLSPLRSGLAPHGVIASPLGHGEGSFLFERAADEARRLGLRVRAVEQGSGLGERPMSPLSGFGAVTLAEALKEMLQRPDQMGVLAASREIAGLLQVVAGTLCGAPSMVFDHFLSSSLSLYASEAPGRDAASDSCNPLGALSAAADMLSALGYQRESECLNASISNVFEAGWRTADIAGPQSPRVGTEALCRLVSEQIGLAGKLLEP